MAENITIGGFTKIRIQTSINFILLWCAPGELNPFDTLQFGLLFLLFMMPIYKGIIGCAKPQRRILSDEAQVTNEIRVRGRWMLNHVKFFIGIHHSQN